MGFLCAYGRCCRRNGPPDALTFASAAWPRYNGGMTNTLAVWLGAIIVVLIGTELVLDTGTGVFLLRKFLELIEWVAFWR